MSDEFIGFDIEDTDGRVKPYRVVKIWRDNLDYLKGVVEFARQNGLLRAKNDRSAMGLLDMLDYLEGYAAHLEERECRLSKDWATHSFAITFMLGGKYWWNGGGIFHGSGDTGVGASTFSVRLGPALDAGWSIHT